MSKHTPGPWGFRHGFNIVGTNGRLVANCGGHSQNFDIDKNEAESEANAYLVAAAPYMLQALEYIVAAEPPNYEDLKALCQDAIAKTKAD